MTISRPNLKALQLSELLVKDKEKCEHKVHRSIFTNKELFELEMKYIFEGNWIYLAHESQIPNINDYYTTYIGRQPIVITKNRQGELNAFLNTCAHRGVTLCRFKKGNKGTFTCPFHGWTFNNSGKLLKIKDPEEPGYSECFNKNGSHDLKKIAKFGNYRGFLFGSLNPNSSSLEDWLGEAKKIIDVIVNQSPEGFEVLKGASTYTYNGNWKLQAENGSDGYHVTATHWNYAATIQNRKRVLAEKDQIKAMNAGKWGNQGGGSYGFENGHIMLWTNWENPENRPNYSMYEEWSEKFGSGYADWMIKRSKNLCLYPNVYLMDQFSSQIRVLRPISVDKTEVTIYCMAPRNESAESRAHRIRQYEDFFNASGMATPDDLEEFRACQEGFNALSFEWNDISRGAAKNWLVGADESAKIINLKPIISCTKTEDEGLYTTQHGYWFDIMQEAIRLESEQE